MSSRKPSVCWKLFTLKGDKKSALCDICKLEMRYSNNSTTNFMRHLRNKHPFELQSYEEYASTASGRLGAESSATSSTSIAGVSSSMSTAEHSRTSAPSTIKYKPGSARKKEIDACILQLITTDLQPLSIVDNKAFRQLLQKLDPRYPIVSRKQLTCNLLPELYNSEKVQLLAKLQQVDHVSITTDCWTSRTVDPYMTVTVHFVDHNWQMNSRVLSTTKVEGSHTGEKIAAELRGVFETWGIVSKVTTIVTDNAANVKNAVERLKTRHQACFAHTLNLVVKDSIRRTPDVFEAKNKVKSIVTYFHHSSLANNALRDAHKTSQTEYKKLKQDVETRWNSTYEMLKSYIFQHDQVTTALCLTGKPELCITPEEVAALREAMATLEPFYEATVEMSSELHTSASKVIPLVFLLQQCLQEDMTDLAVVLKTQLQERFRNVNVKDHLRLATLLDPRFKRDGFSSRTFSDEAVDKLKRTAENITLPAPQPVEVPAAASEESATPPKRPSLLWSQFDAQRRQKERSSARQFTAAEIEVRRHMENPSIERDEDPLAWWKDVAPSTPRLALIAKDVLGIPATSVPSERLFSKAGEVISCRRGSLKPKHVDMILFLNNIRNN